MAERISIKFKLALDDYIAACRLHYARNEYLALEIFAGIVLLGGAVFSIQTGYRFVWQTVAGTLGFFAVFALVLYVSNRIHCWREPKLREECLFEFSDQGIWVKSKYGEGRLEWNTYHKVLENKEVSLLYFQRRLFHAIPKRAFGSAEDEATFRNLLRSKIAPEPL